ncbi:MAG: SDR family NAD(P)-dependent oxidoreductase [Candidatus Lokiarchaeota archaeon]|nr:SDR family NAD(P)-dependent oxidoreductase [Candidatus Lokiarchaeota archaeon]
MENILVTGGAGFIGSYIVDLLIEKGYNVIIIDNLEPQVHGNEQTLPDYLNPAAKFRKKDVRVQEDLAEAIAEVDAIFHQAAAVGVGQSMYQVSKYTHSNTLGTANLLDVLVNKEHNIKKLIVASSMSIYGEGRYICEDCGSVSPDLRSTEQMKKKEWELRCPKCNKLVKPAPTDEEKPLNPTSIYAMSKRHQEEMCLLIGKTYGIPTIALRYFNVYGPRQALSNPYTGVVAIFSSRILNGNQPIVYEDGNMKRDFIHVKEIARANLLALTSNNADYRAYNIGTGTYVTIKDLAKLILEIYNSNISPVISDKFRIGDVRHCYADISLAKKYLEFTPKIKLTEGLRSLLQWVSGLDKGQIVDKFDTADEELKKKGLTV